MNYCNFITYWHHDTTFYGEIIKPTRYNIEDPPLFLPQKNPGNYWFILTQACPSKLNEDYENTDSLREALYSSQVLIDSITQELVLIIDGGNTNALNETIWTSWPSDSIALRNDLLTESPYLSDSVMIASIDKEDVLSSEMITDILSANPHTPKSTRVMNELNNRFNQLTDEQWFAILDGLNILGAKEVLELKLTSHKSSYTQNLRKIIKHYTSVYSEQGSSDSIIALLSSYGDLISYYEIANEYISRDDTINALTVYNSIPNHFSLTGRESDEYNSFGDYLLARIHMIRDGDVLTPDSLSRGVLYSLISDNLYWSSTYARAMLIATDTLTYNEPVILPAPELKQGNRIRIRNAANANKSQLSLFPNPASSYLIVQFNEFQPNNNQFIEFVDMHGKSVKKMLIPAGALFFVTDVSELSSGFYIAILLQNGIRCASANFCIIR